MKRFLTALGLALWGAAASCAAPPVLTATFYAAPGTKLADGLTGASALLLPQPDGTWKGSVNGATVVFNRNPTWQSVSNGDPAREWAISVMDGQTAVGANVSAKAADSPITADFGVGVTAFTALFPAGSVGMGIRVK